MKPLQIKALILGYNLKDSITNAATVLFAIGSMVVVCTTSGTLPKDWEKHGQSAIGISGCLGLAVSGKRGDLQGGQVDEQPPTQEI